MAAQNRDLPLNEAVNQVDGLVGITASKKLRGARRGSIRKAGGRSPLRLL